jgi:membrane associated rhomboid family serine protease
MASGPDLFVVCRSCGREVSPYITECPYCGNRLRKRAPKLERGGTPKPPKAPRRRPSLGRLRPGEMPGIRGERRPYGTILLVLTAIVVTILFNAGAYFLGDLALGAGVTDEYWRTVTTLFVYTQNAYEIAVLAAVFLFGWLLERRHGPWAPLLVFLGGGAGGMALAILAGDADLALGGNGGALALLGAWAVRDLLGRRRGEEDDSDMLGVLAIAVVLVLLPLAAAEASAVAGIGGAVIGLLLGLVLARVPER